MYKKMALVGSVALCSLHPVITRADRLVSKYDCDLPARGILFKNDPEPCGKPLTLPARSELDLNQEGAAAADGSAVCATYYFATRVGHIVQQLGEPVEICRNKKRASVVTNNSNEPITIWVSARLNTWRDRGVAAGAFFTRRIP